jgi:hypothetical protein
MRRSLAFFFVVAIALLLLENRARARVVFSDRFEYAVSRSDPNAANLFVQNGWSHAKTQQNATGAKGYLYTVTSIPGYSGPFPGTNSSRVLAMEALPITLQSQTDFYLQYGDGSSSAHANTIPGDVWFQFWIYPQNSGSQISTYGTRNKFMYVCNTDYPCHSHLWMVGNGSPTYDSNNMFPLGHPSRGEFFWNLSSASGVSMINDSLDNDNQDQLGPTNASEWMRPNRWTLVKMHMNTTATTGNSWEVWLRPYRGGWRKVSEWIGGRTPGFTWNIPSGSVGGHRVLRMPTTVNDDYWMYMDDFVMATTESDLPVYSDSTGTPGPQPRPQPPSAVRIIR